MKLWNVICVTTRVVSRVSDMAYFTVRKIIRRILHFYSYKTKPVHLLQDGDKEVRKTFALQLLARMVVGVTWPRNILWTDEAHFCLNGQVNTHNCRISAAENPHAVFVKCCFSKGFPLHTGNNMCSNVNDVPRFQYIVSIFCTQCRLDPFCKIKLMFK